MSEEADKRIHERPAAHKTKMQRWAGYAFGGILLVLAFNFLLYQWNKPNKSENAGLIVPENSEPTSSLGAEGDKFDELVKRRQQAEKAKQDPSGDNGKSGGNSFSKYEDSAGDAGKGSTGSELSDIDQELYKWKIRERIRALESGKSKLIMGDKAPPISPPAQAPSKSRFSPRSIPDAGQSDVYAQASSLLNEPLPNAGSTDDKRREVDRKIEAARTMRQALAEDQAKFNNLTAAGNLNTVKEAQARALLQQEAGFDKPPAEIAGYTKENAYNADIEGKLQLPPGTEILAQFMRKGISDFQGGQLKGIVSHDVYDISRQYVVIPQGSEVIMRVHKASSVNEPIQNRMGITINWLVLPNGKKIDLSRAAGLDREGVAAIKDQVDYHILAQFLGVAAYAIVGTQSSRSGSGADNDSTFAGDVGAGSRTQASSIAQKYLNIVPTITIRPGQSFYISLEDDLYIDPWKPVYEQYIN